MHYYKATIQYDGTNYFGFQWQKDIPTIQNELNKALGTIIQGKITTMGSSRTDTGVHAFEQFVKITTEYPVDCAILLTQLNQCLPSGISCLAMAHCPSSWKPASDNISKEYRYFFTNILQKEFRDQLYIANNPFVLDIDAMKFCTQLILGKQDFKNFYSAGSNVKTTIRTITHCELSEVNPQQIFANSVFTLPPDLLHCYQLRIIGDGFLKQMIRHLMSALWKVGNGRLSVEEFSMLLNGPVKTKRLWKVATPKGLYLYQIKSHHSKP